MHNIERLQYLLKAYAAGTANAGETEELFDCFRQEKETDETLLAQLQEMAAASTPDPNYNRAQWDPLFEKIKAKTTVPVRRINRFWWAAAALLVPLALGTYLLMIKPGTQKQDARTATNLPADAAPGRNGAILTLADGSQVELVSGASGKIAQQANTSVSFKDDQLVYQAAAGEAALAYNTMSTPKGRQFQLVLPDGSRVWLNAASSIRFPVAFAANERSVSIQGEAYFEVAKDPAKPFRVNVNGHAEVEVLGTHFNINAYENEPSVQTTLLEGSVRISNADGGQTNSLLLKPGQQAIQVAGKLTTNDQPDLGQVLAWKDGYFKFKNADLRSVLRQLERWYDLEVVFEGPEPTDRFGGKLPRDVTANELLKALGHSGVHFRIEGKKLIVRK